MMTASFLCVSRSRLQAVGLSWLLLCFIAISASPLDAQPQASPAAPGVQAPFDAASSSPTTRYRPDYILGGGDQISIRAFEMDDISSTPSYRVDSAGMVNVPTLGRVLAGGKTVVEFEQFLVEQLRPYVREPQVSVNVLQFRSEPVFFVGAFQAPGIYPLQGQQRLVEMLSAIGGLQPSASRRIKVTRRMEYGKIPLDSASVSEDGQTSLVEISMGSLSSDVDPEEDILLKPFDMITVEPAERVYINGGVMSTGGLELGERQSISVAKAITLAGGLSPDAQPRKAKILRPVLDTSRRAEIPIDIKDVMEGKASDYPLLANDILYVPQKNSSMWKKLTWALPVATSAAWILVSLTR